MPNQEINFTNIRVHNNSKNIAFEELCCQLAHLDKPGEGWQFTRKGGSADAGIECYWKAFDEKEYGWQAKYVFDIDDLISQTRKSINTALEKHPNLAKYYVCMPIDFADSRIDGHVTEKLKWDKALESWQKLASQKSMSVEFIPWGKFEITEKLSRIEPEYAGKRYYWFNEQVLTQRWFSDKCHDTIEDVGTRYTPDLNVSIPELPKIFEGLVRSEKFFSEIIALENRLAKLIWHISIGKEEKTEYPELSDNIKHCREQYVQLKKAISKVPHDIVKPLDFSLVIKCCDQLQKKTNEVVGKIHAIEKQKYDEKRQKLKDEGKSDQEIREILSKDNNHEFNTIKHYLWKASSASRDIHDYVSESQEALCAQSGTLVIQGEAGQGKTHIISEIVETRVSSKLPTLFILGQHFSSTNEPWQQIFSYLGTTPPTREIFLSALDSLAEALNQKVLIAIDAINEGEGRKIWITRLSSFINELKRYPRLSLVLSVRSNFLDIVLPEGLRKTNNQVTHYIHKGFRGIEYQAVRIFFPKFNLKIPDTPLLSPEFSNPLFLKLFCSSLHDAGHREVPKGLQGITKVFDFYIDTLNKKLSQNGEVYDLKERVIQKAIDLLAGKMAAQKNRWLKRDTARALLKSMEKDKQNFTDTLFSQLISEGLLIETYWYDEDSKKYDAIAFTYERLADHLIVKKLLEAVSKKNNSKQALKFRIWLHPILKIFRSGHDCFLYAGWIEALCIQIPEKFGLEYFDLFPVVKPRLRGGILAKVQHWKAILAFYLRNALEGKPSRLVNKHLPQKYSHKIRQFINGYVYVKHQYREPFFNSIIWRNEKLVTEKTVDYLNALPASYDEVIEMLLTVASVPGHLLNGDRFHKIFSRAPISERDATLGRALTESYMNDGAITRLIDWCRQQDTEKVDEDSARLCAIILCWSLASPHRMLRDQSTKALVNLLKKRIDTLITIMKKFECVDDLYIRERIFAAAYGASLLKLKREELRRLSEYIYDNIFSENKPPLNVLLRDYAAGVITIAQKEGALSPTIVMRNVRPPYSSEWPIAFPSKSEIESLFEDEEKNTTKSRSKHSIQWELNYGSFGRYESAKHSGCYWYDSPIGTKRLRNEDIVNEAINSLSTDDQAQCLKNISELKAIVERGNMMNIACFNSTVGEFRGWFGFLKDKEEKHQEYANLIGELNQEFKTKTEEFKETLGVETFSLIEKSFYEYLVKEDSVQKLQDISTSKIKRWILKRVFDLGWCIEKFGDMDYRHDSFREYTPNERVGTKYTWLAMREIHCHLNDNLKFKSWWSDDEENEVYQGPWQTSERDIDPSFIGDKIPDYNYTTSPTSWWQPHEVKFYDVSMQEKFEWITTQTDLPNPLDLLKVTQPSSGQPHLVLRGSYSWNEQERFDDNGNNIPHRRIALSINSYLIRKDELDKVIKKIKTTWHEKGNGYWMPHSEPEWGDIFIGEYPWAESCKSLNIDWINEENSHFKLPMIHTSIHCRPVFESEPIKDSSAVFVPDPWLIKNMGLDWSCNNFDFVDENREVIVTSPNSNELGPKALLIVEEKISAFLEENNLVLLWGVWADKVMIHEYSTQAWLSSYFSYDGKEIIGDSIFKLSKEDDS